MTLFYNFANLFDIWLKTADFSYLHLHSIYCNTFVFLEVCEENSGSHKYVVEKKGVISSLLENYLYSFILHQNL